MIRLLGTLGDLPVLTTAHLARCVARQAARGWLPAACLHSSCRSCTARTSKVKRAELAGAAGTPAEHTSRRAPPAPPQQKKHTPQEERTAAGRVNDRDDPVCLHHCRPLQQPRQLLLGLPRHELAVVQAVRRGHALGGAHARGDDVDAKRGADAVCKHDGKAAAAAEEVEQDCGRLRSCPLAGELVEARGRC